MPLDTPPRLTLPDGKPASSFDPLGTLKVPAAGGSRFGSAGPHVAASARPADRADRADVLIVGNGIAGCIAAMETRQYAPDANVLIVTEQNHPTINTPALKQFGAGRIQLEQLLAYPAGIEQELGINVLNQRATALDAATHHVTLANGQTIGYRALLLATGARAAGLPATMPGRDFDGVLTLHTLQNYLDLRRRMPAASSVVVIGGGYHAAETAMLLRHHRVRVTWLIRGRSLLPHLMDPAASDLVLKHIKRQGVDVRLETEAAGIVGRMGTVAGVLTTDDEYIPCDVVIAATGVRPDSTLARAAGLVADGQSGIAVNSKLRTSAPDVYAAGAVAGVLDPQTGLRDARGQWYYAVQQGRLAAAAITGTPIPEGAASGATGNYWHMTQFDKLGVLTAGSPMLTQRDHPDNEVMTNGSGSFYRRIVVRHGHLVGYLAVGTGQLGGLPVKRLIDERICVDEITRSLLAEDFDLRSFFTQRRLYALATGEVGAVPSRTAVESRQIPDVWQAQSAS